MELYRSGHNEAVLKTVCPKGTWVRIPPAPPVKDPGYSEMSVQDLHFINSAKWFFNGAKSAPYA